ncbi:MAG: TIGR03756 family integrating conjugative element protein [Gammaproteobacteria bacterium]|nr:TIGR03756 family integrating conjugative element protein [Gammaproteobacteria bacterium]
MKNKGWGLWLVGVMACVLWSHAVWATLHRSIPKNSGGQITVLDISQNVLGAALKNPFGNFLNYKVTGVCFWLKFDFGYPYMTTTLKVDHFLPDAVVSVYNGYGQNPWWFANTVIDPLMKLMGNTVYRSATGLTPSYGNASAGSDNDMMQKFKEVDVIGNPAVSLLASRLGLLFISTQAMPFQPYYSSLADSYFWRNPTLGNLLHLPYLIPGVRTEGSLLDQWGSIFPRIGYVTQLGDYKAAAVFALRAADIATHAGQTRVYFPLPSGSCGNNCTVWASHENDFDDVKFQEIYPVATTDAKPVFGINDLAQMSSYGQSQYHKGQGNYVWVLWRHYAGCIQTNGQFMGST